MSGAVRSPVRHRGQASLLSLVVALLALTAVTGLAVFVADSSLAGAERDAEERRRAVALSERLVAADAPVTARSNVLNETRLDDLNDSFAARYPVGDGTEYRVDVDGRTVARRGDPTGGATIRRIVLVEERTATTVEPDLSAAGDRSVTLPRRTDRIDLSIDPPSGTTVTTVRVDGRVVLRDPAGVDGNHTVTVSPFETTTLSVEAVGPVPNGSVTLTYYPATTSKAILEVTVDGER